MRHFILIAALMGTLGFSVISRADQHDMKTNITVNETILVPGKELPPGKYVMKLMESESNRHIVQIFNEDQDELQATILAFPNYRVQAAENTVLTYWETPSGSPPALRSWFFPGNNFGQEFAYPKEMAERIARANNNAQVAQYEATAALTPEQAAAIPVENQPEPDTVASAQQPARAEASPATLPAPAPNPVTTATTSEADRSQSTNSLLAQNQPPAGNPALPADTTSVDESELPRTASPVFLVLLTGLIAFAGAFTLRRLRA